jgi:outer membrane receptor for ferrienterochelin and colicins
MKRILIICWFFLTAVCCKAQSEFKALVKDSTTNEALPGISVYVEDTKLGGSTDINGRVQISSIPDGDQILIFSGIGYKKFKRRFHFPLSGNNGFTIYLFSEAIEEGEVTVTSTRTNSRIEDVPVRIEVIGQEDIEEEVSMQPANISMLLGESTGIQSQTTSATSGNVSIRIQGLDGRYTQILKDGFPLYGGFSGSLSIMQIPPLDLKQAEVIKGSSSTLYGADAIAGIINFVSKTPSTTPENTIILNQTSLKETDLGAFFSGRKDNLGYTLLLNSVNGQAVDVNKDGFSDVPQLSQLSFAPRLFYYGRDSSLLTVGFNASYEERTGGDMHAILYPKDSLHSYLERSRSQRNYSQIRYDRKIGNRSYLTIKNSEGLYNRALESGKIFFKGQQFNTYSEASVLSKFRIHDIVYGTSFTTEDFFEDKTLSALDRSYHYSTLGGFIQDDWHPGTHFVLQSGLRADYQNAFGLYLLPRLSGLYHFSKSFSTRLGGGLGYKSPTVFTTEAEEEGYHNVLPISKSVKPENAAGANLDFTYKKFLDDDLLLSINQAFYYTRLSSPLVEDTAYAKHKIISYINAPSPVEAKGFESSLRLSDDMFDIAIAYTYIDAIQHYDRKSPFLPFVPHNRLVTTAVYKVPGKWRFGYEGFFTGRQYLPGNKTSRDFFVMGLMIEKVIKNFSVIINAENLTDTRQTRYESVVLGPTNSPVFRPVWAPLDGRVVNVVVKMRF